MKRVFILGNVWNVWIVCWFAAIWIDAYRMELFFTGLFCLVLCLLIYKGSEKEKE